MPIPRAVSMREHMPHSTSARDQDRRPRLERDGMKHSKRNGPKSITPPTKSTGSFRAQHIPQTADEVNG
eukprot:4195348-Pyramimonas_sp.AAC.1